MDRFREIYRAEQFPIFQNKMFNSAQDAKNCEKSDIVLVQDLQTGFVFNKEFKPDLMQYDDEYQNEQAVSLFFQRHLNTVSGIIIDHFNSKSLIEVGCGKGFFLNQLKNLGFTVQGIDPAYEGSDSSVIKEFFSPEIGIRADGVILRHVLEHVQDPVQFLLNIRKANGGIGKIYIEVPCLDWICKHKAFFDIFYEHVNYFRLCDFNRIFGRIYDFGHIFGGQYLYVIADLETIKEPVFRESDHFDFPNHFLSAVNYYTSRFKTHGDACHIWGGASKGVVFALFMERAGVKVDVVIDINPAKQGKYIASTGLKVHSPSEAIPLLNNGDDILVMNSNYLSEVQELTSYKFKYLLVEHE